jgi:hypothetical protein
MLSCSCISSLTGGELRGLSVILDKSERGLDQCIARRGAGGDGKAGSGISATLLIRSSGSRRGGWALGGCCVEAECHFCYLRDSSIYVHESCHPLTYVGRRKFWDGPLVKYGI